MAENSKIEWTDATWNPLRARDRKTGKVGHYCELISPGCANCYASAFQPRFGLPRYAGRSPREARFGDVELFLDEQTLVQPLRWKKSRRVFVGSMTDLFGEWVPDEWIDRCFAVMALTRQHVHQVLTKRPERLLAYLESRAKSSKFWEAAAPFGYALRWEHEGRSLPLCPFPLPNVWLGTSVEDRQRKGRVDVLRAVPAAVRFLSLEPLLEGLGPLDLSGIGWVIVGGESGPGARPMHPDWARSLRDQCVTAGVPFFFKQAGEWLSWSQMGRGQKDQCYRGWETTDPDEGEERHLKPHRLLLSDGDSGVGHSMYRVGKKAAGRLLDGRAWDEFPRPARP